MNQLFAFEVRVKGAPWGPTTINARTAGGAKSAYLPDVREAWQDVKYTDLRVRKVGAPNSSADFGRCVAYRANAYPHIAGMKCGQKVKVGKNHGVVVGHGASSNFEVLFDDDSAEWAGMALFAHPDELELIP